MLPELSIFKATDKATGRRGDKGKADYGLRIAECGFRSIREIGNMGFLYESRDERRMLPGLSVFKATDKGKSDCLFLLYPIIWFAVRANHNIVISCH